jgi:NADH:ubiquinone oxidoreductase subunit H
VWSIAGSGPLSWLSLFTRNHDSVHSVIFRSLPPIDFKSAFRPDRYSLFLVLLVLTIGVFSLLERVLLAAIQYRQGPVTAMLHGFAQIIADGIKIYSKFSLDVLA